MTETEWLICTNPGDMDRFLGSAGIGGFRKNMLKDAGSCRFIWDQLHPLAQAFYATFERWADGLATEGELEKAYQATNPMGGSLPMPDIGWEAYQREAARIRREVFGNPFRPVTLDPNWLTWRDGTVVKLAQTIYDDRRFDLMPILADALHEAGCTNDDILNHCREGGGHVRGCWVVDLILGKD